MHFYNEIDEYAADWLDRLVFTGEIPYGVVDRRSIEDIAPDELARYTQCHFFAGIGGWPLALKLAGWPEDRPIWTGSCPCQPFSQAGQGAGFADQRHLWPSWLWLIDKCRPAAVFGEQVASKDVDPWIDLVLTDLEALDYAGGAIAFPSAAVGAPHRRERTYWMGYADNARLEGLRLRHPSEGGQWKGPLRSVAEAGSAVRLANGNELRLESVAGLRLRDEEHHAEPRSRIVRLADAGLLGQPQRDAVARATGGRQGPRAAIERLGGAGGPGNPTDGHWRAADWLCGRDGKWRPIEPGTEPLANGVSGRVGRLRAYGNAINPWQAAEFIRAAEEARELML